MIRRETRRDIDAIRAVTQAAFAKPDDPGQPIQARLVDDLRSDRGWLPALSFVALLEDTVVGHVVSTRGYVDDTPALGLGPLSVLPAHQRRGVGSALVHTTLGAADALGEPLVILLGSPAYYGRFGFQPAAGLDITTPGSWGDDFQARVLSAYDPIIGGRFRFADPFARL